MGEIASQFIRIILCGAILRRDFRLFINPISFPSPSLLPPPPSPTDVNWSERTCHVTIKDGGSFELRLFWRSIIGMSKSEVEFVDFYACILSKK